MNPLRDAFRAALDRMRAAGRLAQAAPWVHELMRRLAEVGI